MTASRFKYTNTCMNALSYEGKRVIVSGGGGSGMGAATVELLGRFGGEVHVFDLKEPSCAVASFTRTDLLDPGSVAAAVRGVGGPIDALFNCAGLPGPPFSDAETMLVNFAAARHLTELTVPMMPAGGAIVSISSVAGADWITRQATWLELIGTDGFVGAKEWCDAHPKEIAGGYYPSKEALVAWTHFSSYDLIHKGLRINCTSPGPTATPMMSIWEEQVGKEIFAAFTASIGRNSTPAEQAYPLVFLNHPVASYVNGANLVTDAGTHAAIQLGRVGSEPIDVGRVAEIPA